MYRFNKLTLVVLTVFTILVLFVAILAQEAYVEPEHHRQTSDYVKQLTAYQNLSETLALLTAEGRQYIATGSREHLENYRRLSRQTADAEEAVTDADGLTELLRAYLSFMENEAIPAVQKSPQDSAYRAYLEARHHDFSSELSKVLNSSISASIDMLNRSTELSYKNHYSLIKLLLLMAAAGAAVVIFGLYTLLTTLSIHNLDSSKLSAHIKHGIIIIDRRGRFTEVNEHAKELFGAAADRLAGKNLSEIPALLPQMQNVTQPLHTVALHKKELLNHRVTYFHSGRKLELAVDYIPIFFLRRLRGIILIAGRVEEQKDKHLLLDTLEKERKMISIEIHDWIARYLSTVIHSIDYILRLKDAAGRQVQEQLLTLRSHCQNAAIEMRGIMNSIHPYLIDRIGLVSALESYINIYEKLNNIKVYVIYQDRALNIPKKSEIIIYRIIQEALSNTAKHAQATEVGIHFTVLHDTLKVEIEDNGGSSQQDITAGKGMWGMKERAKLIGGDIIFERTDSGFCVTLTVPVISGGQQNEQHQSNVN